MTETIVNPIVREGPSWTPIPPQTGSFFHAETQCITGVVTLSMAAKLSA